MPGPPKWRRTSTLSSGTSVLGPTAAPQFVETLPFTDAIGTSALGANTVRLTPFVVERPITVNRIFFEVTASSGNLDAGIYDDDGTGQAPGTRLVSSGSTACPANGPRSITIADTTLQPGLYWAALAADNGTAAIRYANAYGGTRAIIEPQYNKGSSFPLPSSLSAPSAGGVDSMFMISAARV